MIVALHDAIALVDGDVRSVVRERAQAAGFDQVEFTRFESALDLVDQVADKASAPLDLVLVPYELPGLSGVQAIAEARSVQPEFYAVAVDDEPVHAAEAAHEGFEEYLVRPLVTAVFELAMTRAFAALRELYDSSALIETRSGARRIALDDVTYCETSGHDQLVHLRNGHAVAGRYSSQALFNLLAVDDRFFKVGSSYIVNLHEVSRLHTPSGELVLADGTPISVPQRLRKNLEETLLSQ
ncbi:MAG: response regulator transcription factor [Eggerthellaceae bacterium]|nr:response regulator transcription factor [Eggerthellaceae bacterium]